MLMYVRRGDVYTTIDKEDYIKVNKYKWHLSIGGYIKREKYNKVINGYKREYISLHRFLLGAKKGEIIDHANGDKLDNRKENLRFCSFSQNSGNAKIRKDNSTGFKGVVWLKNKKKWLARISCKKRRYHLGYFKNKIDAAMAYNKAAIKYFGEFSNLNKV